MANGDEVLDDDVVQTEIDSEQDLHWLWCGKKCRSGAEAKAKKVLRHPDRLSQNYETHEDFYKDASDMFRKKATMDQWIAAYKSRKELGDPIRRVHESTQGTFKNLPNVDKNKKYVIVTFDTMFKEKKGIYTEQITLIRKKNNRYKFVGYYFAQKPFYNYQD